MKFSTTRFGALEVKDETLLTFPARVSTEWTDMSCSIMIPMHRSSGCGVENPELAFVVLDPVLFKPDYQVELTQDAIQGGPDEKTMLSRSSAILTILRRSHQSDCQSPAARWSRRSSTRRCKQLVLPDDVSRRIRSSESPSARPAAQPFRSNLRLLS
ncbi:MAG: hypothetical protein U0361_03375 [Nitrospiraceae bacterium]